MMDLHWKVIDISFLSTMRVLGRHNTVSLSTPLLPGDGGVEAAWCGLGLAGVC